MIKKSLFLCAVVLIFSSFLQVQKGFCSSQIVDYICQAGISYFENADFDNALSEFNRALMVEPDNEVAITYKEYIEGSKEEAMMLAMNELGKPQPEQDAIMLARARGTQESAYAVSPESWEERLAEYKIRKISLNTQASVFSGDYGDLNGHHTTTSYFTETIKAFAKRGDLSVSLPYSLRNGGGVTAGESADGAGIPKQADGIGDIVLRGRYYWLNETDKAPNVDLTGKIKFPAASHSRGLGTGEFDFGLGTSLSKSFGEYLVLADAELILRKRPVASTMKRVRLDYSLGLGYPFSKKFSGYLFVDSSTKTNSGLKVPVEVVLAGTYKPQKKYALNGYLLFGLTNTSPDFGASIGVTRYFE